MLEDNVLMRFSNPPQGYAKGVKIDLVVKGVYTKVT